MYNYGITGGPVTTSSPSPTPAVPAVPSASSTPEIDFDMIGPRPGERFPDVQLPDQYGEVIDLHAARAGHRAMVVFFRSAVW